MPCAPFPFDLTLRSDWGGPYSFARLRERANGIYAQSQKGGPLFHIPKSYVSGLGEFRVDLSWVGKLRSLPAAVLLEWFKTINTAYYSLTN